MSAAADPSTLPLQQRAPAAMGEAAAAAAAAGVDPNIKRLVLVTDAWDPQINGVVRTLKTTAQVLRSMGVEVHLITPQVRPCCCCAATSLIPSPTGQIPAHAPPNNPIHRTTTF